MPNDKILILLLFKKDIINDSKITVPLKWVFNLKAIKEIRHKQITIRETGSRHS